MMIVKQLSIGFTEDFRVVKVRCRSTIVLTLVVWFSNVFSRLPSLLKKFAWFMKTTELMQSERFNEEKKKFLVLSLTSVIKEEIIV